MKRREAGVQYSSRPEGRWFRELRQSALFEDFHKISGGLESSILFFEPFGLVMHSGDEVSVDWFRSREVLVEPFEVSDGVIIPPGDYEFADYGIEIRGVSTRTFAPTLELETGEFFDGDIRIARAGLGWRANRHFFFQLNYEYNDVELPYGEFVKRLIQIDANYAFNSRWSWVNLIQYDNDSNSVGINSRLRWNPRAGRDLYIVVNHGFDALGAFSGLHSAESQLSVKYTQTFRL